MFKLFNPQNAPAVSRRHKIALGTFIGLVALYFVLSLGLGSVSETVIHDLTTTVN